MSGQIGQTPLIQPNIIQNSQQNNAQKAVQRESVAPDTTNQSASQNQNFQKIAADILAARASGDATVKPTIDRGQVVDILV